MLECQNRTADGRRAAGLANGCKILGSGQLASFGNDELRRRVSENISLLCNKCRQVIGFKTELLGPARFAESVVAVVRRIPPGRVATYGDVAGFAGRPRAARAVGNIMRECRDLSVPCHRVVGAGGALGGYGGNLELKRALLRAEGISVLGRRIRSFAAARWIGPGRDAQRAAATCRASKPAGRRSP